MKCQGIIRTVQPISNKNPAAYIEQRSIFVSPKNIYAPQMLYPRIKTFLENFNPRKVTVSIRLNELLLALLSRSLSWGLIPLITAIIGTDLVDGSPRYS